MQLVKSIGYFDIYKDDKNQYLIHNRHFHFQNAHTHISNNLHTANYIAYLAMYKKLPPKKKHLSKYLLKSLIRISDSNEYKQKIRDLMK